MPLGKATEPRPTSENLPSETEQPPLRDGHPPTRRVKSKSRNGCFNCKRRKIKCKENLPECAQCQRTGLACNYPPPPSPHNALMVTPMAFTLDDLRFFQHFLLSAYPSLPIDGGEIWKAAARMSHQYDFLIHAMLALGASHLTMSSCGDYSLHALSHRVQAIRSLNTTLSRPDLSQEDGDAAFATTMSLTFQSTYMPEGMYDYMSMVRGCHIVVAKAMPSFQESIFRDFSNNKHVESVVKLVADASREVEIFDLVEAFLQSLRAAGPLCTSVVEISYLADIQSIIQLACEGKPEAYEKLAILFDRFGVMGDEDFVIVSDPKNYTAQLLLAHLFVVDNILGELFLNDHQPIAPNMKSFEVSPVSLVLWLEKMAENMPQKYEALVEWPLNFARNAISNGKPALSLQAYSNEKYNIR